MSTRDTRNNIITARSTLADGPRLPPLKRTAPPKVTCGKGESRDGLQDGGAVERVALDVDTLARIYEQESGIGKKGTCRYLTASTPAKVRHLDACLKSNCAYIQFGWLDIEGSCIRSEADVDTLDATIGLLGGGYVLATSSSHDPAGRHPDPKKRGQYRIRVFLFFLQKMSYDEYKRVCRTIAVQVARALGYSIQDGAPREVDRQLQAIGIDPASFRGVQPIYFPQWVNEDVQAQAWIRKRPRPSIDVADLLAAARAEIEAERLADEAKKKAAEEAALRRELAPTKSAENIGARIGVQGSDVGARQARLRAYLATLGPARVGGGGHQLGWTACLGAIGLDLEIEDAWPLLEAWNGSCDPERRVSRDRLEAAYRDATVPRGWMLEGRAPSCPGMEPLEVAVQLSDPPSIDLAIAGPPPQKGAEGPVRQTPGVDRVDARWVPPFRLLAKLTCVQSAQGTGKTERLEEVLRECRIRDMRVADIVPLRALARSHERRLSLPCYLDTSGPIIGDVVCSLDSLERIAILDDDGNDCSPDVLVFDECEAILDHLIGDTIMSRRKLGGIYSHLCLLLHRAKHIILLDADLSKRTLDLFHKMLGWDEDPASVDQHLLINTWKPAIDIDVHPHDESCIAAILEACEARDHHIWVQSTTAEAVPEVADLVRDRSPDLRVASVTALTVTDYADELEDPSLWSKRWDVVICSPSVGLGVSVDEKDTWKVFALCRAGAGPDFRKALQGLRRVRHPVGSIQVSITGPARCATTEQTLLEDLHTVKPWTLKLLAKMTRWSERFDPRLGEVRLHLQDEEIVALYAKLQAAKEVGEAFGDVREEGVMVAPGLLRKHLEACGYRLRDLESKVSEEKRKALAGERAEIKAEITKETRIRRLELPPIDSFQAEAVREREKTTEEMDQLWMYDFRRFYGNRDPILADLERDDDGRRRRKIRAWEQVKAWALGDRQAVIRLDRLDLREGVTVHCKHLTLASIVIVSLLEKWGISIPTILQALDSGEALEVQVSGIHADDRAHIRRALGLKCGSMEPYQIADAVLRKLGIQMSTKRPRGPDGKRERKRYIDLEALRSLEADGAAYRSRLLREDVDDEKPADCPLHPHGLDGAEILPDETSMILDDLEHSGAVVLLHAEPHRRLYQTRRPCRCVGVDVDPDHLIVLLHEGDGWGAVVGIGIGGRTHSDQIYAHAERVREATA